MSSEKEWQIIAAEFEELWNFRNCTGAIDGKNVLVKQPANSLPYHFSYKSTFNIVLMELVDGDYKFTYVDVGCNKRVIDGGIFRNSSRCRALKDLITF